MFQFDDLKGKVLKDRNSSLSEDLVCGQKEWITYKQQNYSRAGLLIERDRPEKEVEQAINAVRQTGRHSKTRKENHSFLCNRRKRMNFCVKFYVADMKSSTELIYIIASTPFTFLAVIK